MAEREIPYYLDYLSPNLLDYLKKEARPVAGVPALVEVGEGGGLETAGSLAFLCEIYDAVKGELAAVLAQRTVDRQFIDQRTRACSTLNRALGIDFLDARYETVIGHEDGRGRIVVGPKSQHYCQPGGGAPIAPLPDYLGGHHVTLFGPPDDAKLSINAMNAIHRKLPGEPPIVEALLAGHAEVPKWGADDEDSKTPLRRDLVTAGEHLRGCYTGELSYQDPKSGKRYALASERRALPIKRFPGLALPCLFLLYRDNPLPLHLYDFALHLYANWQKPEALSFYVPKLENEEEARYLHTMIAVAERLLHERQPAYRPGSVRLFIVLESPRAIFRVNEIMDALHPYFAGASLGWHDYLAATARLFKEDPSYRIPVKADPEIVIKYIKASHALLAEVVGSRGGIKIGGMYGVLPMDTGLASPSFQVAIKGFIKDVIVQLKRELSGFWVAHPDFVRLGMALVEAWRLHTKGDRSQLDGLVTALLAPRYHREVLDFIHGPDIAGLDRADPRYPRALLIADIKGSTFIANHHPDEIRYNVFQSLQYLTDWLAGNGCVALPAQIEGVPVRVMDDLATAERSRWEVWHELHHGRFPVEEFLKIAHEELLFIRKDRSNGKKIVQVKWDERTARWYPIALRIMVKLMTAAQPVEFATELLLPFTVESVRAAADPWAAVQAIEGPRYALDPYVERFHERFEVCGSLRFAKTMAQELTLDLGAAERLIRSFTLAEVIEAADFHGDIGENKKTLDATAAREQSLVLRDGEDVKARLRELGARYREKFGVKFLISARDRSAKELLAALERRLEGTPAAELENAREALWEISRKRLQAAAAGSLASRIEELRRKHGVTGAMVSITTASPYAGALQQTLCLGEARKGGAPVGEHTWFELASLSKTLAACFALEYFAARKIQLTTSVNALFATTGSPFRLRAEEPEHAAHADEVSIANLLSHSALNMHYVNGVPASQRMPNVSELLEGNATYGYVPVRVLGRPGSLFQYSGGGFLVLEHLLESLEGRSIQELTAPFFAQLGLRDLSFEQATQPGIDYASGYFDDGREVEAGRKMFPALAAGAMGTAADVSRFLTALTTAHQSLGGCGPISHDTAVRVLHPQSRLSRGFMAADVGLGVFIAEAGSNRLAIHQGANDGFRGLYVHCYAGPDRGKGFVVLCNSELSGVLFVAEAAQLILSELELSGVDHRRFRADFQSGAIPPAEIVNQAYKNLVFSAFEPDLPEAIERRGARDPLAHLDLAAGAEILEVSNQRFARAENLLCGYPPTFDPELYGRQGKIMDSWETARHNARPCDELRFRLRRPAVVRYVAVSTQFHLGNQAEHVTIEGRAAGADEWLTLVEKTPLLGHALKRMTARELGTAVSEIKVSLYPDGGLTRLALYGEELPAEERAHFLPPATAPCLPYPDKIPHSARPLTPRYQASPQQVAENWTRLTAGAEVDLASAALGGRIVKTTNEHYGPAAQLVSPFPPLNMFDGFESARSRVPGHTEEVIVALARSGRLHRIEIDFTYFRNNNPRELEIFGLAAAGWLPLVEKTAVKAYAGNAIAFAITCPEPLAQLKVIVHPDGGMNRLRAYGAAP